MGVVVTPKYNDVMTAVMYRDAAAITQLLDLGWWVDRPDTNGVSPLMAAAWNGDAALVQLLLERGADPNGRARGGSVLDYAGRSGDGAIIEMLKKAGAR
jgi:ankyrin repeat protein